MGMMCGLGRHEWTGCRCGKCLKTRDEGHDWNGCRCRKCGKVRDEGHDWSHDCKKCWRCSKTRNMSHAWNGCRCNNCEEIRGQYNIDEYRSHSWTEDRRCAQCGLEHRCSYSDTPRLDGDDIYRICRLCKEERLWMPEIQPSDTPGFKIFVPDYSGLNESYISSDDRALKIPVDCLVPPPGIVRCLVCGRVFLESAGSGGAISKFLYAPKGCTTLGGHVWWTIVSCCNRKFLIQNTGRSV